MKPETLSLALAQVNEIRLHADSGAQPLAQQARRTLNDICCEWADDLGCMSYPAPVRAALRAAGLTEKA